MHTKPVTQAGDEVRRLQLKRVHCLGFNIACVSRSVSLCATTTSRLGPDTRHSRAAPTQALRGGHDSLTSDNETAAHHPLPLSPHTGAEDSDRESRGGECGNSGLELPCMFSNDEICRDAHNSRC